MLFLPFKHTVYKRTVPKPDIASKFHESNGENRWVPLNNLDRQVVATFTQLVNICIIE